MPRWARDDRDGASRSGSSRLDPGASAAYGSGSHARWTTHWNRAPARVRRCESPTTLPVDGAPRRDRCRRSNLPADRPHCSTAVRARRPRSRRGRPAPPTQASPSQANARPTSSTHRGSSRGMSTSIHTSRPARAAPLPRRCAGGPARCRRRCGVASTRRRPLRRAEHERRRVDLEHACTRRRRIVERVEPVQVGGRGPVRRSTAHPRHAAEHQPIDAVTSSSRSGRGRRRCPARRAGAAAVGIRLDRLGEVVVEVPRARAEVAWHVHGRPARRAPGRRPGRRRSRACRPRNASTAQLAPRSASDDAARCGRHPPSAGRLDVDTMTATADRRGLVERRRTRSTDSSSAIGGRARRQPAAPTRSSAGERLLDVVTPDRARPAPRRATASPPVASRWRHASDTSG